MGIEPTSEAWEASILPLYDARSLLNLTKVLNTRKRCVLHGLRFQRTHSSMEIPARGFQHRFRYAGIIALSGELFVAEAFHHVVVDDTGCLHERVADRWSHETE